MLNFYTPNYKSEIKVLMERETNSESGRLIIVLSVTDIKRLKFIKYVVKIHYIYYVHENKNYINFVAYFKFIQRLLLYSYQFILDCSYTCAFITFIFL